MVGANLLIGVVSAWHSRRQLSVHGNKLIWRVIEVSYESMAVRCAGVTGGVTACPVTAALGCLRGSWGYGLVG